MRLRKIRLSGFKSFVDPTTILLPKSLVAVVGPNGCGKSNVIDAIRWVMGEISAKHLRGDLMADVIFNGSHTRRPMGQASVEITFDNSEGRLGGQYAAYSEIAIKRQVSRDGQSSYYLNGRRCRRRDITEIFLGTGLGPRSYAIIEQGMISRLIEAKPDELRQYLEEAAGISKYKERRRETEHRMRHCEENLARLNDVRSELERQLQHLKRQAKVAKRYQDLKQQQRAYEAELLALQWRALDLSLRGRSEAIQAQENTWEALVASQRALEAALEQRRVAHVAATENHSELHRQALEVKAEVARLEESLQHLRARREELRSTLKGEEAALHQAQDQLASDDKRMAEVTATLRALEPNIKHLQAQAEEARDALRAQEDFMQAWQSQWEELNLHANEAAQSVRAQRSEIQFLERQLADNQQGVARIEAERGQLDPLRLEHRIQQLEARCQQESVALEQQQGLVEETQAAMRVLRERLSSSSQALHTARGRLQAVRGRLASLQALRQESLGEGAPAVRSWLKAAGLADAPRLVERLEVMPDWQHAVETALNSHLEAICLPLMDGLESQLDDLTEGKVALFETSSPQMGSNDLHRDDVEALSDKVKAPWPMAALLAGVYAVDGLDEALAIRKTLSEGESVITRKGVWIGVNWMRVDRGNRGTAGMLEREQEIRTLESESQELEAHIADSESELESHRVQLEELEERQARTQAELAATHRQYVNLESKLEAQRSELQWSHSRLSALDAELTQLRRDATAKEQALSAAHTELERLCQAEADLQRAREAAAPQREEHQHRLGALREHWQRSQDEAYQVRLRVEGLRSELKSLEQGHARGYDQMARLRARCDELAGAISEMHHPLEQAEAALDEGLFRHRALGSELETARQQTDTADEALKELEHRRQALEADLQGQRATLEQLRMDYQGERVRRDTVAERIEENGHDLATLNARLAEEANEEAWRDKLSELAHRIARLGPINLAALDEFERLGERKDYLDAQHADLMEALSTLQTAIRRIDRETQTRFKDTFDKVNAGFGPVFSRLFGGGHASLQMTGSNLLDTGIVILARPPGKRNSTIHLLSGGEKALAAVALIFAIFELNPAPFCMLDEVDAPLDDANVGRFCELVKDMTERLQLVVVTHNKTTMETSQHLIGVTMNEPGVSRLVSVDVDEAVQMAAV